MKDIEIKNRKIPDDWQGIGVEGDNGVEWYRFVIDRYTGNGTDLYEGIGTAVFRLPDETEGFTKLNMELVDDNHIGLIWEIGTEATQQPGTVLVSIHISGLEERLWHSEIGRFTVGRTLLVSSSQPTRIMRTSAARIANPEQESPITVVERTILIPAELQNIAVQNDQNSEDVTIVLPRYFDGFDLSVHNIYLRTVSTEGGRDDILFTSNDKSIVSNEIHLSWMLKPPQTSYKGRLSIQLVVQGENFQWASASTNINIVPLIDGDPIIPVEPSIYEQWMKEFSLLADDAQKSRENAAISAELATESASVAKTNEINAEKAASDAKSNALLAKEYQDRAAASAESAKGSESKAEQSVQQSTEILLKNLEVVVNTPYIGTNGNWFVWDNNSGNYIDSGTKAQGEQGINGVAVATDGIYAFNVDKNGHLILSYTGKEPPDFSINNNGHLILNF